MKQHHYNITTTWKGNTGSGTSAYSSYDRAYTISAEGKTPIEGSSDIAFKGDGSKYNPEEMLVAAISSCHMLWYLHLCAEAHVVVESYVDEAFGIMEENITGGGRFTEVILKPKIRLKDISMYDTAAQLHSKASQKCFIAASINFPISYQPEISVE